MKMGNRYLSCSISTKPTDIVNDFTLGYYQVAFYNAMPSNRVESRGAIPLPIEISNGKQSINSNDAKVIESTA